MKKKAPNETALTYFIASLILFVALHGAPICHSADSVSFSAITLYHPIVMYQKYQPLMSFLSAHTPFRFVLKLSQDYRDIVKFLRTNEVQVALLGGVTYVTAKKEFDVLPILKPVGANGSPNYRSVFIARTSNHDINTLADLKGKRVAFASKLSTSGNLAPLYHLYAKAGMAVEDFSSFTNLRYHDSVARDVLRGEVDAGAVIDSVAERFEARGLKVIAETDPIPGLPIVVRADVPPELIASLKKAMLSLNYSDPTCCSMMERWDEEFRYGFTEAKDEDYNVIRTMMAYLKERGVNLP